LRGFLAGRLTIIRPQISSAMSMVSTIEAVPCIAQPSRSPRPFIAAVFCLWFSGIARWLDPSQHQGTSTGITGLALLAYCPGLLAWHYWHTALDYWPGIIGILPWITGLALLAYCPGLLELASPPSRQGDSAPVVSSELPRPGRGFVLSSQPLPCRK
jgi:hypothetical protein